MSLAAPQVGAALCAALAVACLLPLPTTEVALLPDRGTPGGGAPAPEPVGWMMRLRWLWSGLAGLAAAGFVSGRSGWVLGALAAAGVWVTIGRAESPAERRRREAVERDLPGLVHLLGAALASGSATGEALRTVCAAYPGPAAELVSTVPARLALGVDAAAAWSPVLGHPALAPLGRTMVRAQRSGSSVADEVTRLADELAGGARLRVEERARSVGVKAALPLGLCLLPAFLLIGIVPLVVGLMRSLQL